MLKTRSYTLKTWNMLEVEIISKRKWSEQQRKLKASSATLRKMLLSCKSIDEFDSAVLDWLAGAGSGIYEFRWIFNENQVRFKRHFVNSLRKAAEMVDFELDNNERETKFRIRR